MGKITEQEVLDTIKEKLALDMIELETEGQWDSLDQVQALIALDEKFNIKFGENVERELGAAMTPKKIIDILRREGLVE
jgi:acyl carrier protein